MSNETNRQNNRHNGKRNVITASFVSRMLVLVIAVFAVSIFTILSSAEVYALGVSPAKYDITYHPDKSFMYSIWVLNSDKENITFEAEVTGELSGSIEIVNKTLYMRDDVLFERLFFIIHHPSHFDRPGSHTAAIIIKEHGSGNNGDTERDIRGDSDVTIKPSVQSIIDIFVPYEGLVLESGMNIESKNPKHPIMLSFPIVNRGSENASGIVIEVNALQDGDDVVYQKIIELSTDEIHRLNTNGNINVGYEIDELGLGYYDINATIRYWGVVDSVWDDGDKTIKLNESIEYGQWLVTLESFKVPEFNPGGVTDIFFNLKNDWNIDLDDVYAIVEVTDISGYWYTITSSIRPIDAYGTQEFSAYWDTNRTLQTGEYFFTIQAFYADKSRKQTKKMTVERDRVVTDYYSPSIRSEARAYDQETEDKKMWLRLMAFSLTVFIMTTLLLYLIVRLIVIFSRIRHVHHESDIEEKKADVQVRIRKNIAAEMIESSQLKEKQKIEIAHRRTEAWWTSVVNYLRDAVYSLRSNPIAVKASEKIGRKRRIATLLDERKSLEKAVKDAKNDMLIMNKAIYGLRKEFKRMSITEKEFRERTGVLLQGKDIAAWEIEHAEIIFGLERRLKDVNDEIWKEG